MSKVDKLKYGKYLVAAVLTLHLSFMLIKPCVVPKTKSLDDQPVEALRSKFNNIIGSK